MCTDPISFLKSHIIINTCSTSYLPYALLCNGLLVFNTNKTKNCYNDLNKNINCIFQNWKIKYRMSWGYEIDNGEYHFPLHDYDVFNYFLFFVILLNVLVKGEIGVYHVCICCCSFYVHRILFMRHRKDIFSVAHVRTSVYPTFDSRSITCVIPRRIILKFIDLYFVIVSKFNLSDFRIIT